MATAGDMVATLATVVVRDVPGHVRQFVYFRAGYRCEHCRCVRPLELHHLRYWTDDGDPIHGSETPNDLMALCRDCHHRRHVDPNGDFWRDPEEMEQYWQGFYDALDKDD